MSTAEKYRAFAEDARGRSPAYQALAASVADDAAVLRFPGTLPPEKRQPNLLFAAARLPPPLALIKVGASAGLTLLFDRYSYDYAGHRITGVDPQAPILRCTPRGSVPLPDRLPAITWRAGLDLSPLDVTSDDDVRWLSCLVWPGEGDREQRLAAARRDPPVIHRGDLLTDLPALAAHGLPAVWLSSEGPAILPGITVPAYAGAPFVLTRDGQIPLAFTDSHGTWLHWLPAGAP